MERIILASASPRRKALLEQVGISFQVIESDEEEVMLPDHPSKVVEGLAEQKADNVLKKVSGDCIIIGADTVVALKENIMGKPQNANAAKEMLQQLQGRKHQVYTGVAIIHRVEDKVEKSVFFECTEVTFYPMSEEEIEFYAASGEPEDKAGAYAIQGLGAAYVKEIKGDFHTVVGLPISRIYQELHRRGIKLN